MNHTVRDTMKVQNTSFFHVSFVAEQGVVFHFGPGEIIEIPTKYIFMTEAGLSLRQVDLVVIDTLPDLLEVNDPIDNRWDILDL